MAASKNRSFTLKTVTLHFEIEHPKGGTQIYCGYKGFFFSSFYFSLHFANLIG